MNSNRPLICIGLGTYKRPQMLLKALESMAELILPKDANVTLLLCDNEPQVAAKDVFLSMKEKLSMSSIYLHEPRKGLVYMRNKILDTANEMNANYLAYFDDDEVTHPHWIISLYDGIRKFKAVAVGGPVIMQWPQNSQVESQIRALYDNKMVHGDSGSLRKTLATNNVLMDLNFIRTHNLRFNMRFNLLGGEDSFFFDQIRMKEGKMAWCNEALVYAEIIPERNSQEFIWKRRFRIGQTQYIKEELLYGKKSFKSKIELLKRGFNSWGKYFFCNRDKEEKIELKRRWIKVKGMIVAMMGKNFKEYESGDGY